MKSSDPFERNEEYEEFILERLKLHCSAVVEGHPDGPVIYSEPKAILEKLARKMSRAFAVWYMAGQTADKIIPWSDRVPDGPLQRWKKKKLPVWILKFWKVRYKYYSGSLKVNVSRWFPNIIMPPDQLKFNFVQFDSAYPYIGDDENDR